MTSVGRAQIKIIDDEAAVNRTLNFIDRIYKNSFYAVSVSVFMGNI